MNLKIEENFLVPCFAQMNEAYDYIDFRNQNHSTFSKLRRIDRRDYPEEAVREALAKSSCPSRIFISGEQFY